MSSASHETPAAPEPAVSAAGTMVVNPRLTLAIHSLQSVAADLAAEGLFEEAEGALMVALRVNDHSRVRMLAAKEMACRDAEAMGRTATEGR